jgi:uncharacterized protein (DUF305 family)
MKSLTAALLFSIIFAASCTRRPVQKDIVIDHNSAANGETKDELTTTPNAADAPYELQFIDTMIVYLGRAIDAAQLVRTRAQHDELKKFARSMIHEQQSEIAMLRKIRSDRYGNTPRAINMVLPGLVGTERSVDLEKLDKLKELGFDLEFIREMVPHLEASVAMSDELLSRQVQPDIAEAADRIRADPSKSVEQLKAWERSWSEEKL